MTANVSPPVRRCRVDGAIANAHHHLHPPTFLPRQPCHARWVHAHAPRPHPATAILHTTTAPALHPLPTASAASSHNTPSFRHPHCIRCPRSCRCPQARCLSGPSPAPSTTPLPAPAHFSSCLAIAQQLLPPRNSHSPTDVATPAPVALHWARHRSQVPHSQAASSAAAEAAAAAAAAGKLPVTPV